MRCPHCESADTSERRERTELGYRRFRCQTCKREFNERTGTRFNHLQYPTDVVCLVVLWRVRYKLSLRDLREARSPASTPPEERSVVVESRGWRAREVN